MTSQLSSINQIIGSGIELLSSVGLNGCSVEAIASRSCCAKGLVNYHFGSKDALLLRVAERLRDERHQSRVAAMDRPGSAALDALWRVTAADVRSGCSRAWLALLSNPPTAESIQPTGLQIQSLTRVVGEALEIPVDRLDPVLLQAGLEGIEVRLLCGAEPILVREAYDRFWLGILNEDSSGR